ncbi:MAG: hypothetical protein ATN31_09825 [Candidatus Epulonipiscioides saccharophilum]|nr:MAG: hypothetical protein ATN31_09825 [Epulopiscium sp. AS2M-Bin001]
MAKKYRKHVVLSLIGITSFMPIYVMGQELEPRTISQNVNFDENTYINKINELKKLIYTVDKHIDISSDVPTISYEKEIELGETTHHKYNGVDLEGNVKVIQITDKRLAANYPIPDLIWPNNRKPDNIKLVVNDMFDVSGRYFVNELPAFEEDRVIYSGLRTLGRIDLVHGHSPETIIKYKIEDTITGKVNYFNLILKYIDNSSRSTPSKPGDLRTTNAIPIYVSEAGDEIAEDKYWVTEEVYTDLKDELDNAVAVVMNVLKDVDFGPFITMQDKFEEEIHVDLWDKDMFGDGFIVATKPDSSKYKYNDITGGTLNNYSDLGEIETAITNLETKYVTYISSAEQGKGTALTNIKKGKFQEQIAKAMLGLKNITVELPNIKKSADPLLFQELFYGLSDPNPIYLYARQEASGNFVACKKEQADSIILYESHSDIVLKDLTRDENFSTAGADYFIAPIVTNEKYKVGMARPGEYNPKADVVDLVPMLHYTIDEVVDQMDEFKPLFEELNQYTGIDTDGNTLAREDYLENVKAGLVMESGNTKIENVTTEITETISEILAHEGQKHKKQEAVDQLKKLLIHLGYYTCEPYPSMADPEIVDESDFSETALNKTELFDGEALNLISEPSDFDIENYVNTSFNNIDVREVFYNISEIYGIDILDSSYWVTQEDHDKLEAAAKYAYDLLVSENGTESGDLTLTQEQIATNAAAGKFFYTTELVQAEVDKLQTALDNYNNSAKSGNQTDLNAYISELETDLFNDDPDDPDETNVDKYFELPLYNKEGKIIKQLEMTPETGKTFISDDGIYALTKEKLTSAQADGDGISDVNKYQLITGLEPDAIRADYSYVSLADVKTLEAAIEPLYQLVSLKSSIEDYPNVDDDMKAQIKKLAQMFVEDKARLETLENDAENALSNFEDEKKPIITYAKTRDLLKAEITTARESVKKDPDTGVIYPVKSDELVVSDDGGFTYQTYNPTANTWSGAELFESVSSKKWISSENLRAFNVAIERAENIIEETRAIAYEIKSDGKMNETPISGEPNAGTQYAKISLAEAAYDKIVDKLEEKETYPNDEDKNKDYFETATKALEIASTKFGTDSANEPTTKLGDARSAYNKFKADIGNSYTVDLDSVTIDTKEELGYLKSSGLIAPQNASGIKNRVCKITDTSDKTSYFPVDVYVVDDELGIVNPITNLLYGKKLDTSDPEKIIDDGDAPTTFVPKDVADNLIRAIEVIDKVLVRPVDELFKSYSYNSDYFDDLLYDLESAKVAFDSAVKEHIAGGYESEYKTLQAKILNNNNFTSDVSEFTVTLKDGTDEVSKIKALQDLTDGLKNKVNILLNYSAQVFESEKGVYKNGDNGQPSTNELAENDYWVTSEMFKNLKDAIWNVQELVNEAKTLKKEHVEAYARNENYFTNQLSKIGLDQAVAEFKVTKVETPVDESSANAWMEDAENIIEDLFGGLDGVFTISSISAEEEITIHVSELTDGFDVLTLSFLESMDKEQNGISEEDIANWSPVKYYDKTYIELLRAAWSAVKSGADDANVKALAELVNLAPSKLKVVAVRNNPKVKLYNNYLETLKALQKDGQDILPSDNAGANIPNNRYWTTSTKLEELNTELEDTRDLLNQVLTEKANEDSYIDDLEAQIDLNNEAAKLESKPGTVNLENSDEKTQFEEFEKAKADLLALINSAAELAGKHLYNEKGEQKPSLDLSDNQIFVSDNQGVYISGEDNQNNDFKPDAGDKWVTSQEFTTSDIANKITEAVNEYNNSATTKDLLETAKTNLQTAITNLENAAKYGALSTYQQIVNHMQTYINNIDNGNSGYDHTDEQGNVVVEPKDYAPIIKVGDIVTSEDGSNVLPTKLWATSTNISALNTAKTNAQNFISTKANIAENKIEAHIAENTSGADNLENNLIAAHDAIKEAYELFYGRDIYGKCLDEDPQVKSQIQYGTATINSVDLALAIQDAVSTVNNLVYMANVARPTQTYTKFDGTPRNEYEYEVFDLITGTSANSSKTYVAYNDNGLDIPDNCKWITQGDLETYIDKIQEAQTKLDEFENEVAKNPSTATDSALHSALTALNEATKNYNEGIAPNATVFRPATEIVLAYKELYAAVRRAYSLIGLDINGQPTNELTLFGGTSDLIIKNKDSNKVVKIQESENGQEISTNYHWVINTDYGNYKTAITNAITVLENINPTEAELEAAKGTLQTATGTIIDEAQSGQETAIKDAKDLLKDEIVKAEGLLNVGLVIDNSAANVSKNKKWTTQDNYDDLIAQLTDAQNALLGLNLENSELVTVTITIDNLKNKTTELQQAIAEIKDGTRTNNSTETEQMQDAKADLEGIMNYVALLKDIEPSEHEGRDIPDGVAWVTTADISTFKYSKTDPYVTQDEEKTPIAFITEAYEKAIEIYDHRKDIDDDTNENIEAAKTAYKQAAEDLKYCKLQFERVMANENPETGGALGDGVTATGGIGTQTSIVAAKAVLKARIDLVKEIVKDDVTKPVTDLGTLNGISDGEYYALDTKINELETANSNAESVHTDTDTSATVTILTDALDTLNTAYESFINTHRKLKGVKTVTVGSNQIPSNPLSETAEAIIELLTLTEGDENDQLPILPVSLVLDGDNVKNQIEATDTNIIEYIETLISDMINKIGTQTDTGNDLGITVKVSDLPISPSGDSAYTEPTKDDQGSIQGFTVTLTDQISSGETKVTWTIKPGVTSSDQSPSFVTPQTLKVMIAPQEDQWNNISTADIKNAARSIIVNKEKFEISDNLYTYGDTTGINTKVIARNIKKQIEELINDPDITVNIYNSGASVSNGDLTGTDLTDVALNNDNAITKPPVRATLNSDGAIVQGTEGELNFKVILSMNIDNVTGLQGRSATGIMSEITEITNDENFIASVSVANTYTVLLDDPITAKIIPAPYVSDPVIINAVNESVRYIDEKNPNSFTIETSEDDPGNTINSVNAQLATKIATILAEKELTKKVTFEIVEDFSDTKNGFKASTTTAGGNYDFKIIFSQKGEKNEQTVSAQKISDGYSVSWSAPTP